ncbi:MAG: zinc ribbon domain-containing protein [Planctomycetota bacterium]|nr:zinc ribbon domain-containing protein [Planctomycetota bacterium]MDA1248902.1 zinc ribbon domain-containing protein [Planctomycetota bacterium]
MPIFEYQCEECSTEFELLVRSGESPECPSCGTSRLNKLFSAPAAPVIRGASLPMAGGCPPSDAPPCRPNCCRLP